MSEEKQLLQQKRIHISVNSPGTSTFQLGWEVVYGLIENVT